MPVATEDVDVEGEVVRVEMAAVVLSVDICEEEVVIAVMMGEV